jgi:peroxiredoxin
MPTTPPVCDFGVPASDFMLKSTQGDRRDLASVAGPNGLVIAFICNHCPYVLAVLDRIIRDARDLAPLGVGFAAVCSNDARAYPADSFDNMVQLAQDQALPFPYLHDEDQSVARAYGAECTPDFFGYNGDLKLQYRGRIDASRGSAGPADLRRDLFEAMSLVAETGDGPRDQIASMGCSIKWAG